MRKTVLIESCRLPAVYRGYACKDGIPLPPSRGEHQHAWDGPLPVLVLLAVAHHVLRKALHRRRDHLDGLLTDLIAREGLPEVGRGHRVAEVHERIAAVLLALGSDGQEKEVVAVTEADVLHRAEDLLLLSLILILMSISISLVVLLILSLLVVYYVSLCVLLCVCVVCVLLLLLLLLFILLSSSLLLLLLEVVVVVVVSLLSLLLLVVVVVE